MYTFKHTFPDLEKFDKFFVGADKFAGRVQETMNHLANTATSGTYPPFNLKKTDENVYVIEMAVAGFGRQDIELTLEENKLLVKGQTTLDTLTEDGVQVQYLHKGISDRAFSRSFVLNDNVVVNNAQMVNGLLKIWLEHVIPEHKKPKKIDIEDSTPAAKGKKQLLTEDK